MRELDAERFVADWFDEHHAHEGVGYETGPWSRFMTCACSPEATHTVEIIDLSNATYEEVYAARKSGAAKLDKVYVY